MRDRRPLVALVPALFLAACGGPDDPAVVPAELTPDGIAEVVADHVERNPKDVSAWDVMTRELEVDAPGAALEYGGGDFLGVAVAPTTDSPLVCADTSFFD